MDILDMTLCELVAALDGGGVSSAEATAACLKRIKDTQGLNSFITVCEDAATDAARRADERRARGERAPLLGVPVAVKDNIVTDGIRTTSASKFLQNLVPPYDATVVQKLKAAGLDIGCPLNADELVAATTRALAEKRGGK